MKRCPSCDAMPTNVDGDSYCYRCGTELVSVPRCAGCERTLTTVDVYCPRCGKKVEG